MRWTEITTSTPTSLTPSTFDIIKEINVDSKQNLGIELAYNNVIIKYKDQNSDNIFKSGPISSYAWQEIDYVIGDWYSELKADDPFYWFARRPTYS